MATLIYVVTDLILDKERIESAWMKGEGCVIRMQSGETWKWEQSGEAIMRGLAALTPNSPELTRLRQEVAQLKLDKTRLERELAEAKKPETGRGPTYNRGYNAGYQAAKLRLAKKLGAAGTPEESALGSPEAEEPAG